MLLLFCQFGQPDGERPRCGVSIRTTVFTGGACGSARSTAYRTIRPAAPTAQRSMRAEVRASSVNALRNLSPSLSGLVRFVVTGKTRAESYIDDGTPGSGAS